ncbi:MAG: PD40 domain-containing protein, partial [Acidobacteria bacterium]|nr:PD40 domain-containing protein [Acidobacteriota bacterium]
MGTPHYMSPEVLQGKDADVRSDIFALGTVLYEMFSGRKAFDGNTPAETVAAILDRQPSKVSSLRSNMPPAVESVIERCLRKERADRCQSADDVLKDLRSISTGNALRRIWPNRSVLKVVMLSIALLVVAGTASLLYFNADSNSPEPIRFSFPVPDGDLPFQLAISPDGTRILFKGHTSSGTKGVLWLRSLDSDDAKPIPGTEGARDFFWSAGGKQIGFFVDQSLRKISVNGGPRETVCECAATGLGATWNGSNIIVFGSRPGGLKWIYADGGETQPLTTLDENRLEINHTWPQFLPDGRRFLYLAQSSKPENTAIFMGSLDTSEKKLIVSTPVAGRYTEEGFLVFVRDNTIMAQVVDPVTFDLRGPAVPVLQSVNVNTGHGLAAFAVSPHGTLVYRTASITKSQLVWFNRNGQAIQALDPAGAYRHVVLSPDGNRAAVTRSEAPEGEDIWVFDLVQGGRTKITRDKAIDLNPVWSPDGTRIIFSSSRNTG